MGRIEYRLSMAAGVRSAGRLDESRLPEGTEMFLPDGPAPEVVHDEDEDDGGQRTGNRFPERREAERDDPIHRGSAGARCSGCRAGGRRWFPRSWEGSRTG